MRNSPTPVRRANRARAVTVTAGLAATVAGMAVAADATIAGRAVIVATATIADPGAREAAIATVDRDVTASRAAKAKVRHPSSPRRS